MIVPPNTLQSIPAHGQVFAAGVPNPDKAHPATILFTSDALPPNASGILLPSSQTAPGTLIDNPGFHNNLSAGIVPTTNLLRLRWMANTFTQPPDPTDFLAVDIYSVITNINGVFTVGHKRFQINPSVGSNQPVYNECDISVFAGIPLTIAVTDNGPSSWYFTLWYEFVSQPEYLFPSGQLVRHGAIYLSEPAGYVAGLDVVYDVTLNEPYRYGHIGKRLGVVIVGSTGLAENVTIALEDRDTLKAYVYIDTAAVVTASVPTQIAVMPGSSFSGVNNASTAGNPLSGATEAGTFSRRDAASKTVAFTKAIDYKAPGGVRLHIHNYEAGNIASFAFALEYEVLA